MDMRKYCSGFIKPDDVRDGPLQVRIINVYESQKYGCPVLEIEDGNEFSVNVGNARILAKAYGWESDGWLNQVIELALGHYKDWNDNNQEKETVVVRPISVRQPSSDGDGTKAAPKRDDLNDAIPF
jgi:hypothetical protein